MTNCKTYKHVCFVIGKLENKNGTERVTTCIANKLSSFHKITILSLKGDPNKGFPINKDVKVFSLNNDKYSNKLAKRFFLIMDLISFIKSHNIDIMVNVDITLSLLTIPLKRLFGYKVISWEHFNYFEHHTLESKFTRYLSAKHADTLIVLGENDLINYKKHFNNHSKFEFIYNPIALNMSPISKLENKVVLAAGRLETQKGFDLLLDAWKIVEKNNNEWKLQIVGSGSQEFLLKEKIIENNLQHVEMISHTDNIEEYYLNASIFTLSSRYEGFGLVLLEAQAKGLPVVSFNCKEGPAEIVEPKVNGELVENGNIVSLAGTIIKLIEDEELLKYYGSNAQKYLGKFDWGAIVEKWCRVLDEC